MADTVAMLTCPVCFELMGGRIYQCVGGHSLCQQCESRLEAPKKCPICIQNMTEIRNINLESLVEIEAQRLEELSTQAAPGGGSKVNCRFQSEGCKYVLKPADSESHVKECIFRDMLCPFNAFDKRCHWIGKFGRLKVHFSEKHPEAILIEGREYEKPDLQSSTSIMHLIALDKVNFILYSRFDMAKNLVLIAVQNVGTKAYAQNWNYEIKFYSAEEPRRSFVFADICTSDAIDFPEIFQKKQCIAIPKNVFQEYGTELRFKVFLKKNESMVASNRKGPKPSSNAPSSSLTLP